ncbi:thioredoxin domain-containing protein [Desulfatiferula olefinivorans]
MTHMTTQDIRTRHRNADGSPKYTNKLIEETSPYLLQHAHNPVNWHAWGKEAFEKARALNRPLFVSIGYAACHWCHVMEEESFDDEEIAAFLNDHFVCVKVDREERPDVDAVYMAAVQVLTGSGGWPLNVMLTPSLTPFFGGTYFPARDGDRGAFTGFLSLIRRIGEAWLNEPEHLDAVARQMTRRIREHLVPADASGLPSPDVFKRAVDYFKGRYDRVHGGIKGAPKFPSSLHLRFLITASRREGDASLFPMVSHTLTRMARGGIYDQVGGGFHRYATDEAWRIPHFEKMLYDNALLSMTYAEAYAVEPAPLFRETACDTLDYALRELRAPGGGFYSATDADSKTPSGEMVEGYYFTWTPDELIERLGRNTAKWAMDYFSMDGRPDLDGRFVLHVTPESIRRARARGDDIDLRDIRRRLYSGREDRPRPLTDTKIISAWNGLMISALARAGRILSRPVYTEEAVRTARFVIDRLMHTGRLKRTVTGETAGINGFLDDNAFMTAAFLDLFDTSGDPAWLSRARGLDAVLETFYEDRERGGFFMTASDDDPLIAREKPGLDGAIPSGNAQSVINLVRLYAATKDRFYLDRAEKTLTAFSSWMETIPGACGDMLMGLDAWQRAAENR